MSQEIEEGPAGLTKHQALEAMVIAALGGHELGVWEPTRRGWQAKCKLCTMTVWVGESAPSYSLLADKCPGVESE